MHVAIEDSQPPTYTHRAKHPMKVHVWAAISKQGCTGICIFKGTVVKELYVEFLDQTLLPFIRDVFPDGHRLMQDNDPKHVSKLAKNFLRTHNVNWWTTPPGSHDANPIKNLWHKLKEFIHREVKPCSSTSRSGGLGHQSLRQMEQFGIPVVHTYSARSDSILDTLFG